VMLVIAEKINSVKFHLDFLKNTHLRFVVGWRKYSKLNRLNKLFV
jgi:hypothetical protein